MVVDILNEEKVGQKVERSGEEGRLARNRFYYNFDFFALRRKKNISTIIHRIVNISKIMSQRTFKRKRASVNVDTSIFIYVYDYHRSKFLQPNCNDSYVVNSNNKVLVK